MLAEIHRLRHRIAIAGQAPAHVGAAASLIASRLTARPGLSLHRISPPFPWMALISQSK